MKELAALLTSLSQEMRQARTVTVYAMVAVVGMVLGSLTIHITDTVRIGFSGVPVTLVSHLFGPAVGGMFGGALDAFKCLVKPMGSFMSGLILIVMLKELLYGCLLYKKLLTLWRVLAVQLVVAVMCNLFLNTLYLSLVYGEASMVFLAPCIIRNLTMWPIDTFILSNTAKVLEMTGVFRTLGKIKTAA